jgi:phospholipid N-methyltransferase
MGIWSEYGEFWKVTRRNFKTTGALLPSSPFLARALAAELEGPRPAGRILEVGPGTGVVTKAIARRMKPGDHLDCVELNTTFADSVRELVASHRVFAGKRDKVNVITSGVEDLPGTDVYDYIVSGLPLNSFPAALVRRIFQSFSRLLKPGGVVSYFEYVLVRELQKPFVNKDERRRLHRVGKIVGQYITEFQVRREHVLMNVPPAVVRHLILKPKRPARRGDSSAGS